MKTLCGSDSKPAAHIFSEKIWQHEVGHFFTDMRFLKAGYGECSFHGKECGIPFSTIDCLTASMPCQAWTRHARTARPGAMPADHAGWDITFQEFFKLLDHGKCQIRGGFAEQVVGFAETDNRSSADALQGHTSPWGLFVAELRSRGFLVSTFRVNMLDWINEPARDRLYIVFLGPDMGGRAAMRWMESVVQDCS